MFINFNAFIFPQESLKEKILTSEKQEENEDELIVFMHERFLAGRDHAFIDYEEIDNNEFFSFYELI